MNRRLFITLCMIVAVVACRKDKSEVAPTASTSTPSSGSSTGQYAHKTTDDSTVGSLFIPADVANQMISSYIYSLGSAPASTVNDLKSFSIDADSLRAYLANNQIRNVKLMFGHTMSYINAGNSGKYAGMQSGALTIILAGYDSSGNYVYYGLNSVLDHALPCPFSCPPGNAGSDVLQ